MSAWRWHHSIKEFPMKLDLIIISSVVSALLPLPACGEAEARRSPITVHLLDTSRGQPAAAVTVILEQADGKEWREVAKGKTDGAGRIETLLPRSKAVVAGVYRVTFESGAYFAERNTKTFYPRITVIFEVVDPKEHYHIPLLLSPFAYSTYRGS
jgi:5-hydroxyisourate hydrolase